MEFKDIILLAWRHKKKLFFIPVLAGLAALSILQLQPATYEARGSIVITDSSSIPWLDTSEKLKVESQLAKSCAQLMKTRPFLMDVSNRLPFETDPLTLACAITIDNIGNSGMLRITARAKNADQAAVLINSVIDCFPPYSNQINYPVVVKVLEKAEAPAPPLLTNRIYVFVLAVSVMFLWILNVIMFYKCLGREAAYEHTL